MPHDWRDPVEEFPSRAISVQDVTTLPGIIFAAKVIHYFVTRGVTLMKSITEKNGGLISDRLSQEQIRAEFSTRICDLESHINRDEKETVRAKEGIAEEIKREDCESDTTGIPIKAKETARPSNRRRKLRIYLPG